MRVLLVVIDAASPRVVCPAIQTGRLPNLKRVADAGAMHPASVTIFPSITPAATASIITGAYPSESGIVGAAWYDEARREVAYYGDDFWTIAKRGFGAFLCDFLVRLNGDRLQAPTLFELIEGAGRSAACVNYLVFRGAASHRVKVPWHLALLAGVRVPRSVRGPSVLCLGDFVASCVTRDKIDGMRGHLHRFGMDDASSAAILAELAGRGMMGDFTVAYFADNDYRSHEVGPHAALPVIERVDLALGRVFEAAGGFERFARETCVIVTSDHGHCEVLGDAARAVIAVDEVFGELRRADIARGWRRGDQIMICPNMRAAQIYVREAALLPHVVRAALAEPRIDLVFWRDRAESDTYHVESQRGRLVFRRGCDDSDCARDPYGTAWSWRGEGAALRLDVDAGRLEPGDYPNAFERIAGALDAPHSGELWLTAQPGCEFQAPGGKPHVGGASHGALHALDSLSPVIVGGAAAPALPTFMRSIDIAPLCMDLLGLPMRYRVGDSRPASQRG